MSRLTRIATFLSPWIAVGLAAALVAVYLHPSLLPTRGTPPPQPPGAGPVAAPAATVAEPATTTGDSPAPHRAVASYADAVARGAPAVVNISTKRVVLERQLPEMFSQLFPGVAEFRKREEQSRGSGVILDPSGHVATNFHVIQGMQEIVVQLIDGRTAPAKLVGTDPDTDLALLKIDVKNLPVMPLGRSDQLRVGDVVLAIGNSLGLGQTVTQGIVSATGRAQLDLAVLENFIQTDAAINPGNSGGALVNSAGELVGINTAILSHQAGIEGIGFAIPVNLVRGVTRELEAHGRIVRGWSGLVVTALAENASFKGEPVRGVQITDALRGSPAIGTGLAAGDVITHVDGVVVANPQEFLAQIARKMPGSTAHLKLIRPGQGAFQLDLPIAQRPLER